MMKSGPLVVLGFCVTFAPAQKIEVDYQQSHDFSGYRTFAWAELDKLPIIRVEERAEGAMSDQDLDRRIRSLVEAQLAKKDYRRVEDGKPDFLVSYLAVAQYDLSDSGVDAGAAGYGSRLPSGHWRPFYDSPDAHTYGLIRSGTLAIDVVDAASGTLVWRGTAQGTFAKPKEIAKKLDGIVRDILRKFPPK